MHTHPPASQVRALHLAQPTFVVRAPHALPLPPRSELLRHLHRHVMTELGGWLQLAVLERLLDGRVQWSGDRARLRLRPGLGEERLLVVRCADHAGPRRPGLWAALTVAHGLARLLEGRVVDPRRATLGFGPRSPLPAPADGRVRALNHLCVPSSAGPGRSRWLSTIGMIHFGLPDLELVGVPAAQAERGARLLLGTAQHLIESRLPAPRPGLHPRELVLTVGELHWALGGELGSAPISRGRGWTRVELRFDPGRAWPELLRLCPPAGARKHHDTGAWLRSAWLDLFGPAPNDHRQRAASA